MTNFYDAFDVRPFTLWLDVQVTSQSTELNRSYVQWYLRIRKDGNSTPFNNNTSPWSVTIAGQNWTGNYAYNMNQAIGGTVIVASGGRMVYHNADGTMAIGVESWFNDSAGLLDYAFLSGSMSLPTIPRASTPSFSASAVDFGEAVTINTNRASSSFTHTIKYTFGSATGTIATGVATSHSWTPPLSLLNEIPNATAAYVGITLETYSGATLIGTKTVTALQLVAPATVVPDFTTVTHSETTAGVAANVGAYVQGISKLTLAITGAAGIYGSTISSYQITVGQQTINAVSGVTPNTLTGSGTVTVTGKVTDSRGRSKTKTVNITVLPYSPPAVTFFSAQRSTAGGVLDPEGTSLRIDLTAAASSLMNTTERNDLTLVTRTRLRGDTTWSTPINSDPVGLTYNNYYVIPGTFGVEDAWDVRVEVVDDFNIIPLQTTVAVAEVFLHWGPDGIGVGKFHENGRLDVNGDGVFSGSVSAGTAINAERLRVSGTGEASLSSTDHALQIGPDSGANLALDTDEIQARNNGSAVSLNLNTEAGNVNVGTSASTIELRGRVEAPHLPYAMAAGTVAGSFASGGSSAVGITVTLPGGRFTQAPLPFVNLFTAPNGSQKAVVRAYASTTTSLTCAIYSGDAGTMTPTWGYTISWLAVQMQSGAAAG